MRALLLLATAESVPAGKVLQEKEETINPVTCDAQTCPWKPYSNSKDFTKDAWLIFAILFCLLFLAITLNAVVRCIIRRRRRRRPPHPFVDVDMSSKPRPTSAGGSIDIKGEVVVFSAELMMEMKDSDCAICLSDFEDGERVKVLDGCKHGFHVHCIKEWLFAHSSCPICRGSITIMV